MARSLIPPYLRDESPDDGRSPPDDPMVRPTDEDEGGSFPTVLLASAIVFALLAIGRIVWNFALVGDEYGLFFPIDRATGLLQLFALYAIAAGVWRGRA